jgi:hypothetical protein
MINLTLPIESSTLSPKIQRKTIFPIRWNHPPCINMEVKIVMVAGKYPSFDPKSEAGTTPKL